MVCMHQFFKCLNRILFCLIENELINSFFGSRILLDDEIKCSVRNKKPQPSELQFPIIILCSYIKNDLYFLYDFNNDISEI